jgi:hypothetical protein
MRVYKSCGGEPFLHAFRGFRNLELLFQFISPIKNIAESAMYTHQLYSRESLKAKPCYTYNKNEIKTNKYLL